MIDSMWGYDNMEWTRIKHHLNAWDRDDLRIWINENIEGDYRVNATYIFFEDDSDAVLFKLKYT